VERRLVSSVERLQKELQSTNYSQTLTMRIKSMVHEINGMFLRNGGRSAVNFLLRNQSLLVHRLTKSRVRLVCFFAFFVARLIRHHGMKGAVNYLKASSVLIMQGIAKYRIHDMQELKVRVKRQGSGLPV